MSGRDNQRSDADIERIQSEARTLRLRSDELTKKLIALTKKIADLEEEQRVRRAHLAERNRHGA